MRIKSVALVCLAALALPSSSFAMPIELSFGGTISNGVDVLNTIGLPTTFSGTLTYETETAPAFPGTDQLFYGGAVTDLALQIGTHTFTEATAGTASIAVANNLGGDDNFQISLGLSPMLGYSNISFTFSLRDTTETAFSSTALPTELSLADFDGGGCGSGFGPCVTMRGQSVPGGIQELNLVGRITEFSATPRASVPEPATLFLVGVGLCAAIRRRRS